MPFIALFTSVDKTFSEWFERRFGPEAAKTIVRLLDKGEHTPIE